MISQNTREGIIKKELNDHLRLMLLIMKLNLTNGLSSIEITDNFKKIFCEVVKKSYLMTGFLEIWRTGSCDSDLKF